MPGLLETSYAATSLNISPSAAGGGGIAGMLRDQLAEQAKRRERRPLRPGGSALRQRGVSAVKDLFEGNPLYQKGSLFGR